jgi:3-(3-hydroxy-phenyl)propionate hydroxylase
VRDLIIVGGGPVGVTAANLAGARGLSAVVIERASEVFDLPRAIHFDAHIMRILQQADLAKDVAPSTRIWERSTFYGADGLPIRVHEWGDDVTFGWSPHYLFYQPVLEQALRAGLERYDAVEMLPGSEVVDITQTPEHVTVWARDLSTGQLSRISGRYLLGADGASSFVRTACGIQLLDDGFDEPWLVVDVLTEREVGRPNESEMFCDPRRPKTRVPGAGHHHRWEFMLLPGETADEMQRPATVRSLMSPWLSPDEATILRASVYRFHSLMADRWQQGRAFLVGDAAHQTPPFLGQGLCHGLRDVHNLIWKLSAVLEGADAEALLESYEGERRPHVRQITEMAVAAGRDICLLDPDLAAQRDVRTRARAAAGDLPRTTFQGMPPLSGGRIFSATPGAGELSPQPQLVHPLGTALLDDLVPADVAIIAAGAEAAALIKAVTERLAVPVVSTDDERLPMSEPGPGLFGSWLERHDARFAVLRPDRYVYGTSPTAEGAVSLLDDLCALARPRRQLRCANGADEFSGRRG